MKSNNSSFQKIGSLLGKPSRQSSNSNFRKSASWWAPVFRGLVADSESKHRKALGPAIWLLVYLFMYANRKTGIVHRTQETMVSDTGYSLRSIQSQLNRLRKKGYILTQRKGRYLEIAILKWKGFRVSGSSGSTGIQSPLMKNR